MSCARIASGTDILINGDSVGTLTAVYRIDREYDFLTMLAWLLVLLKCVGALLALATGRFTASRMLRPISGMIHRARSIDANALDARLEVPEAEDELRLLAQTINGMLDRVEAAHLRQAQFAQDASHELRTPLAVLQGNADLLARWGKDDPAVRDTCIAAIQRQTAYMHRMVENLLFLTRGDGSRQALNLAEVDLPALLQEVAEVRWEIDPLHRYALDAPASCKIRADETLIRQLLLILMDNAAKYTPEGGDIRISAMQRDGMLELEVRNMGCGVPEDQLERIFDRFYRVDKARARESGGAGLGLSIARTIVQLHRGTIRAENARPGLRVRISLPA